MESIAPCGNVRKWWETVPVPVSLGPNYLFSPGRWKMESIAPCGNVRKWWETVPVPVSLRDEGLLDSALNAPFQAFDGVDVYKTVQAKAAKLGFFLVNNHPFVDGNKQIGILTMLILLGINGIEIKCTDDELIELGLGLADGSVNNENLLGWIIDHS